MEHPTYYRTIQALASDSARRALAVAGMVGCVAPALCSDATVLARFHIMNAASAEDSVTGAIHPRALAAHATVQRGFHSSFGDEGAMPDLDGAIGCINSVPLSQASLRGKVVLVDFWTYTCINSLRPLPYVKSWSAKYQETGLVVIGVPGAIVFRFHSRDLHLVLVWTNRWEANK
jgi:hypothetical protein